MWEDGSRNLLPTETKGSRNLQRTDTGHKVQGTYRERIQATRFKEHKEKGYRQQGSRNLQRTDTDHKVQGTYSCELSIPMKAIFLCSTCSSVEQFKSVKHYFKQ